jgi:CubicO group peptidase (beta-lactamase class C family)
MPRPFPALVLVVMTAATLSSARASAPQTDPAFDQLAALVTRKMTEYGVPGVAFGIVKSGRTMTRGFGVTNVEDPRAVTPDTVFGLASISKTVTATAIMRLVDQGRIDLSAPVQSYLPGFRIEDEAASRTVTIADLLTHTPGWEGQITPQDRGPLTLAAFVETMKDLPLLAPPGTIWSYNNAGFAVAGRVVEVVTKLPIQDALRTLVFEPIGLTRAFTRIEDLVTYPFSVAHRTQGGRPVVIRPLNRSPSVAVGGVSMSLTDALAYGAFHLGDGTGRNGQRVMAQARLDEMRTARLRKAGTDDAMGIGWHLRRVGGVMTAAHGGTLGFCLLLELVPERNLVLAILTNHAEGWRLIQDVERASLTLLEGLTLDPAQTIAHRGVNETMPDAPILATQPAAAPYVGVYRRPPSASNTVHEENGRLMVDASPIAFYAPDRAVVIEGADRGNPVEFIRRPDGTVAWVRVVGRIARKD